MPHPSLTFLGAAGCVTGSRFLVESDTTRVLVDAGLFQGPRELRRRNWEPFPVDPATIGAVVCTHAHLDHVGYLPRLVRDGFRGEIVATPATCALARIVLRDSAHLQEEDAAHANAWGYSRHHPALPLYDGTDVERTLALLRPLEPGVRRRLTGDTTLTLRPAGHILGSAVVELDVGGHRLVVTGDLGRPHHPILRPPSPRPDADTVVVESTYGDRRHPEPDPELLARTIRRTVARGGTVLVPAFAVDRTELVLLELKRLLACGEIPRLPVHVDSPMALETLQVYRSAVADGSHEVRREVAGRADLFDLPDLHAARTSQQSRELNRPDRPCIVVSASGMASGGRVVHHLEHLLPDARNTVVLTGYQAAGTRGRSLVEGARSVKVHGRYVPVRAEVVSVVDFSVHADADELVAWLGAPAGQPRTAYVVHGEPEASRALAGRLDSELGWTAVVPRPGERVLLD